VHERENGKNKASGNLFPGSSRLAMVFAFGSAVIAPGGDPDLGERRAGKLDPSRVWWDNGVGTGWGD